MEYRHILLVPDASAKIAVDVFNWVIDQLEAAGPRRRHRELHMLPKKKSFLFLHA